MSNQNVRKLQTLQESIEEATREVEASPQWLKTIYERNRQRAAAAEMPSGAFEIEKK